MKLDKNSVQSLYHAALCCQGLEHASGIAGKDNDKSIRARLACYEYLRNNCRELEVTVGSGSPEEELMDWFIDSAQADDLENVSSLVNCGSFVCRTLQTWGRRNGVNPHTAELWEPFEEGTLFYLRDAPTNQKVFATEAQRASLNKLCIRYTAKPVSWWLETKGGFPSTLFAQFPTILIGIETDGYAHS